MVYLVSCDNRETLNLVSPQTHRRLRASGRAIFFYSLFRQVFKGSRYGFVMEKTKSTKERIHSTYKTELKKRYLDYVPQIREFLLAELKEGPILKNDLYQRLQDYNLDLGTAIAALELNAQRMIGEWPIACNKALENIIEGVKEVTINKKVYFQLNGASKACESSFDENKQPEVQDTFEEISSS